MGEQDNINVLIGSAALPYAVQVLGTVAMTHKYVEGIGADGVELIPTRSNLMRQVLRRATVVGEIPEGVNTDHEGSPSDFDIQVRQLIKAGHSSFDKGENETRSNNIKGLVSRLRGWFFTAWDESLVRLSTAQTLLERPLSVVMYGEPGYGDDYSEYTQFGSRSMQPKGSVWKAWGLEENSPVSEVAKAMKQHGVDTFTWDTAHGQDFEDSYGLLQRLLKAGLVQRMHLSIGRSDQKKRLKELGKEEFETQTDDSRRKFIASSKEAIETPEGQQLALYLRHMKQQGLPAEVVLEEMPQLRVGKARDEQRQIIASIRGVRDIVLNKEVA